MKKQVKNIVGYTLMELVIALSIIGILVGIAAPTYVSVLRQAKVTSIVSRISLLTTAANIAYTACEQAMSAGKSNTDANIYPLTGPNTASTLTLNNDDFYGSTCFPTVALIGKMAGAGIDGEDGVFRYDANTWTLLIDSAFTIVGTDGDTTTMPTFASSQTY